MSTVAQKTGSLKSAWDDAETFSATDNFFFFFNFRLHSLGHGATDNLGMGVICTTGDEYRNPWGAAGPGIHMAVRYYFG